MENIRGMKRTHRCAELTAADAGKEVVLMGWAQRRRDLGALVFVTLRDRSGIMQVVFNSETNPELHEKLFRSEVNLSWLSEELWHSEARRQLIGTCLPEIWRLLPPN